MCPRSRQKSTEPKQAAKEEAPARKKKKKQNKPKLNFAKQCFFTDISDQAFYRALPTIKQAMPHLGKNMTDAEIRVHLNAILYLSTFYAPWCKIQNFKATQRFYYRLRQKNCLGILQRIIGVKHPLDIRRPVRKNDSYMEPARKRKCPPCPKCGLDDMICYGTRHQGSAIVRNYRCRSCGQTKLWVTTCNHEWWRDPRGAFKNHPTYCS